MTRCVTAKSPSRATFEACGATGPYAYHIIPVGFDVVVGAAVHLSIARSFGSWKSQLSKPVAGRQRTRAQFVTNTSHELRRPSMGSSA